MNNKLLFFLLFFTLNLTAQLKAIDSLVIKASIFYDNEKYNEVIDFVDKTKINFKKELASDSLNLAYLLFHQANSYYYLKNYLESIKNLNAVINSSPSSKRGLVLKGKAYYEKAFSEYALQDYLKSVKSLKIAESILSKNSNTDKAYLLNIYAELGSDLSYLGNYNEALFYLDKGLAFLNKVSKKDKLPRSKTYYATNLHFKYIETYHNALIPNSKLKNLKVANLKKHLKYIKSLRLKSNFTSQEEYKYAFSYNLIGDFYINGEDKYEIENIKKAHKYLNKALTLLDKNKYSDAYIEILFNKSKAYFYEKKHSEALNTIDEIFSLIDKEDSRKPFFYAQKGRIYLEKNMVEEAKKEFFKMASEIHSDTTALHKNIKNFKPSNVLNESELLSGIADESINKNKTLTKDLAYLYELSLIQFKHNYKASPFNFKLKNYYEKAIRGVLKTGNLSNRFKTEKILENIENIENILSVKEFLTSRKQASIGIPNKILKREMALRLQLTNAIEENKKNDIYAAKNELNNYLRALEEKYPTISKRMFLEFNIQQFQKELPYNTVVLRYVKAKELYCLFIITKTEIKQVNLDKVAVIDNKITNYIKILKSKKEDKLLGNLIFKELIPDISLKNQRIIIVSDGKLRNLPFETLVNNDEYLIKNNKLSYASHLAFITNISKRKTDSKRKDEFIFLAYTPSYNLNISKSKKNFKLNDYNLNGAKEESEIIAKLFKGRNISNKLATKKSFIEESKKAKILHLSMHADINNKQPELSYLLFAGNDSLSSNKMYIEELCGLNLSADIAVLSACNTGVGNETVDNKGVVSLHNAFTYSGVPTTVSSLWKVPDKATKQIMISFYKNLKLGYDKSEALQKAKIDFRNSVNDLNIDKPYFWAGFVLYGDFQSIYVERKYSELQLFLYLLIGVTMFLVVVFFTKKRLKIALKSF